MVRGHRKRKSKTSPKSKPISIPEEETTEWFVIEEEGVTELHKRKIYRLDEECQVPVDCNGGKKGSGKRRHLSCPPRCLQWLTLNEPKESPSPPREIPPFPGGVGLSNPANVCWFNALLHPLTLPLPFRQALYNLSLTHPHLLHSSSQGTQEGSHASENGQEEMEVEKTDSGDERKEQHLLQTLGELVRLTGQLWEGTAPVIDPSPLLKSLGIPTAVQQDPHEFLNLFLGLLERPLGPAVRSQWAARLRYCIASECGHHRFSPPEVSFGISLPLALESDSHVTPVSLPELLQRWRRPSDVGEGECSTCGNRGKVRHSVVLERLPPTVVVQLLRFAFANDSKTKTTLSVDFPLFLSLEDLVGISANEDFPEFPAGTDSRGYSLHSIVEHRGKSATGGHYVVYQRDLQTSQWWLFNDSQVTSVPDISQALAGKKKEVPTDPNMLRSGDAYLLFYHKHTPPPPSLSPPSPVMSMVLEEKARLEAVEAVAVSQASEKEARRWAHWEESRRVYPILVSGEEIDVERMDMDWESNQPKKEDKELKEEEGKDKGEREETESEYWIAKEWLQRWGEGPCGPIENEGILCSHGGVDPEKVSEAVLIPWEGWRVLQGAHGGGPAVGRERGKCSHCSARHCRRLRLRRLLLRLPKSLPKGPKKVPKGSTEEEEQVWISAEWLQEWKTRHVDFPPTLGLLCSHGALDPEADGRIIPFSTWELVSQDYPEVSPVLVSAGVCGQCSEKNNQLSQETATLAHLRAEQRVSLAALLSPPPPLRRAVLVPSSWLRRCLRFLRHSTPPPGPIPTAALLCSHGRVGVNPLGPLGTLGRTWEDSEEWEAWLEEAEMVGVAPDTWETLSQLYSQEGPTLHCTVDVDTVEMDPPGCQKCQQAKDAAPWEWTILRISEETAGEGGDAEGFRRVTRKRPKGLPTRGTRGNGGNSAPPLRRTFLRVEREHRIDFLQLHWSAHWDCHPRDVLVYYHNNDCQGNDEHSNGIPGNPLPPTYPLESLPRRATVKLQRRHGEEEETWEEEIPREVETGFVGSQLVGGGAQWACAVCTLHNPSRFSICQACETPKPSQEQKA